MKKIAICTILLAAGAVSLMTCAPKVATLESDFGLKKMVAITLGYDKSMSEKTIKAAVIDSYFRKVCQNGKLIRWNKNSLPLKVYVQDSSDVPAYYREVVMSAYQAWQRASEGLVRFEFVESPQEADMKCYFKSNDNKDSIGVHAFSVNGNTIAVLGNGIDYYYPKSNEELQKSIINKGLIISEYPLMTKPIKENFPNRNRIIAALCDGVLVIESKKRSGTMITVNEALNLGKDIMCVPTRANENSGCNYLIKNGAHLVENGFDVIEILK